MQGKGQFNLGLPFQATHLQQTHPLTDALAFTGQRASTSKRVSGADFDRKNPVLLHNCNGMKA